MTDLRKYIRGQILKEGLRFDNLKGCSLLSFESYYMLVSPDFGQTLKILAEEWNWNGNSWMDILDFVNSKESTRLLQEVYGMIHVSTGSNNPYRCWEVKKSAAKPGWGPTLYDVIMGISPNGLMADRDEVSSDAFRVYEFYLESRDDIEKKPIDVNKWTEDTLDDGEWGSAGKYTVILTNKWFDEVDRDDTLIDPLNWVYNRERVPQTDQLIKNGIEEVRNYVVPSPMDSDLEFGYFVIALAKEFFDWRYE